MPSTIAQAAIAVVGIDAGKDSLFRTVGLDSGNRWLPVDFRYTPFATKTVRQRSMLRWPQ
jgi:hypothetical protein